MEEEKDILIDEKGGVEGCVQPFNPLTLKPFNPLTLKPFNLQNGHVVLKDGEWLAAAGQPVAYRGAVRERGLRGLVVPDRAAYRLVEASGEAWFADAARPFLTHVPCAAPITAVAAKVLVAPAKARTGAENVRLVPLSWKGAVRATRFEREWVIFATQSRVEKAVLGEDEVLTVQAGAAVAWTTKRPVGYVPRLKLGDVLLPRRRQANLAMHFYGPGIVWFEGVKG